MATTATYKHFGLSMPENKVIGNLWEEKDL
jgi:hypothetical protein